MAEDASLPGEGREVAVVVDIRKTDLYLIIDPYQAIELTKFPQ
jgi:hypothetical protein